MYENDKALIVKSQSGDKESMQKLIEKNNGLIWSVVRKFWYRDIETDDLYQIGCIGFIKAVRRFDFDYNVELSTYAVQYIFGEIKKFIRDDGIIKVSRNIKELGLKIKHVKKMYGENIKISKIAEILKVSEEEICMAMDAGKKIESINQYIYEDSNFQIQEKIIVGNNEEDVINKILVSELIDNLAIRDKKIIELRYFKEKTQTQVAGILGISQVQVSRIERKLLRELKEDLVQGEAIG